MDEEMKEKILSGDIKLEVVGNETFMNVNGERQKLNDIPIDISDKVKDFNYCALCGAPSGEYPLFTLDTRAFICRDCVLIAYDTYLKNGIPMPISAKVEVKKSNE